MPIVPAIPNQKYTATAGQTSFPYDWPILDAAELQVYVNDLPLALGVGYTVTGVGAAAGGNVLLTTPALAGASVVLRGQVPLSQDLDYAEHTPFPAQAHEGALDKLTRITQQLQEELNRSVRQKPSTIRGPVQLPDPSTVTPVQGGKRALVYNDAGTDLELLEVTTQIGSIVEIGLVDDTVPALASSALPTPATAGRLRQVVSGAPAGLYHDTGIAWVGPTVYDPANKPGVDVSAKIAAVLADMTASGGVIDARAFRGAQAWGTQVNLTQPIHLRLAAATYAVSAAKALSVSGNVSLTIEGAGIQSTQFLATTAQLQVIEFLSNGHLHAKHLYASNGGIGQTGGYLINLSPATFSVQSTIEACTTDGLYDGIFIGKANGVFIHDCTLLNCTSAEIRSTYMGAANFDAGNTFVRDCVLASNNLTSTYGIKWDDQSGLYVENCTILGHGVGIAALSTQNHVFNEIDIYNNRINLQGLAGITIQRASGTGAFAQCHISDNTILSPGAPATIYTAILLGTAGGASDIFYSEVVHNRLTSGGGTPVTLLVINHGDDLYVDGNMFVTSAPGNTAIGIPAAVSDVRLGRNKYRGFTPHSTLSGPPIVGVVNEPEIRPGNVSVDPGPIVSATQGAVNVTIPGLRPLHGDRIFFERQGALNASLIFLGSAIGGDDFARLYFYNTSGASIDDGPLIWNYTWIDIVP